MNHPTQQHQRDQAKNQNSNMWPKLKFYGGFDEEKAGDAEVQGAAGKVLAEFEDGRHFEVAFESADSIKIIIDRQMKERGVPFYTNPGLIILEKVTLKNMRIAVKKLVQEGEFGFFTYLKEWDSEKEKRYHAKYLQGIPESTYQYPTVPEV